MKLKLETEGRTFEVELVDDSGWIAIVNGVEISLAQDGNAILAGGSFHQIQVNGNKAIVNGTPQPFHIHHLEGVAGAFVDAGGKHGPVKPPMNGKLEQILVKEGQEVARGDVLFVLEAMKMRNEIKAAIDGMVTNIQAAVGDAVDSSNTILEIQPA